MRLGGPIFKSYQTPQQWISTLRSYGYSAGYCPIDTKQSDAVVQSYAQEAEKAGVVIAEVSAWSNPLSRDEKEAKEAIKHCQQQLALADAIGARCCINVSGSRGRKLTDPDPDNLTDDTFDLIVQSVRKIIDAVRPRRTFYALEIMPWSYPDSLDSYLKLIKAIKRDQFAVHFDPANLISSPQRYLKHKDLIREFVGKLGKYIKSCHAKDVFLNHDFIARLDEVRPGLGGLDYRVLLQELNSLSPHLPLMLERLPNEKEYALAAKHIRNVAKDVNVIIR